MKKACILWIVLVLVISGCGVSLAEGRPIPNQGARRQQQTNAEDILLNQAKTILIPVSESVWLRFIPAKTDGYCFYSSYTGEDIDPVVYLFDENMELLDTSDDTNEGDVNFRLFCMLESGKTYYFSCESTAEEDGECPVMLTNASGLIDAEAAELPENPDRYLTLNVNVFATAGTALSYRWYQEVLEESDEAEIIDDSYYKILEGEDREFLIIVSPDEGTGYCCKVSDDQGHEKTVFFSLEGSEEEAPEDEDTWSEDEDPTDEDEEENEL